MRQVGLRLGMALVAAAVGGCSVAIHDPPARTHPALAELDWLVGHWSTSPFHSDSVTEEHWMTPSTSNMFGIGRTLKDGEEVFIEYLRLTVDHEELVYCASPGGRLPPTEFRAVECSPRQAVFENLAHDYPQRIIYELQPDGTIKARVEGDVNGTLKASEWSLYPDH